MESCYTIHCFLTCWKNFSLCVYKYVFFLVRFLKLKFVFTERCSNVTVSIKHFYAILQKKNIFISPFIAHPVLRILADWARKEYHKLYYVMQTEATLWMRNYLKFPFVKTIVKEITCKSLKK